MNYDDVIVSALPSFPHAREFQELFANAEHSIVEAQRDIPPDGWRPVHEWISRAHLHSRYVFWLVVAIEISSDGTVSELEEPKRYVVEVDKIDKSEEGPTWEASCAQFAEGGWEELVEHEGDFAAVGLEMKTDAPVGNFAMFWDGTRPSQRYATSVLKAPLRFMS